MHGLPGDTEGRAEDEGIIDPRWQALPAVIRTLFDCSCSVQLADVLRTLGVTEMDPAAVHRRCYTTPGGVLAVPVWHDEIEQDTEGSWLHWIDGYCWRGQGAADRDTDKAKLLASLQRHVGEDVYVIHLRGERGPDEQCIATHAALDIVMWRLEAAGQHWFVVRRPAMHRADA